MLTASAALVLALSCAPRVAPDVLLSVAYAESHWHTLAIHDNVTGEAFEPTSKQAAEADRVAADLGRPSSRPRASANQRRQPLSHRPDGGDGIRCVCLDACRSANPARELWRRLDAGCTARGNSACTLGIQYRITRCGPSDLCTARPCLGAEGDSRPAACRRCALQAAAIRGSFIARQVMQGGRMALLRR